MRINRNAVAPPFERPLIGFICKPHDATPLGLNSNLAEPRVAAKARQPWAVGRNRFAVHCLIIAGETDAIVITYGRDFCEC